jgi:predicted O-methyltransferase YrrM
VKLDRLSREFRYTVQSFALNVAVGYAHRPIAQGHVRQVAMNYELHRVVKSLRRDGLVGLARNSGVYARRLWDGAVFDPPHEWKSVDDAMDFVFTAGHGLIRPSQVRSELLAFAHLVRELQPRRVVEIGTGMGGTLYLWCQLAHPNATLVSVDLPGGIHGGGYPTWKTAVYRRFTRPGQRLHLLRGDSHAPALRDQVRALVDGPVDLLFLDGDHTFGGVKRDFTLYAPLVRQGGIIGLHDICVHPPEAECEVHRFWNEVKTGARWTEFIEDPAQGWAGIGVAFTGAEALETSDAGSQPKRAAEL